MARDASPQSQRQPVEYSYRCGNYTSCQREVGWLLATASGGKMRDPHVIAALKEKRARVAGELVETRLRALALKVDLEHIDGCLKVFRAGFDPTTIEPKVTF